jgi:pimeloyl-ACP methyl ester carboxylesterase
MTTMARQQTTTQTVGTGTETVTYDVHGDLADVTPDNPPLFMLASPMDAVGFTTLRGHFTDRVVVTYDPRGAARNPVDTTPIPPEEHAKDLHAVISDLGVGPVDVFASSGGAVNVLALAAAHPEDVRTVVAHEPPTLVYLPDRDNAIALCHAIKATYEAEGSPAAMARFITTVMLQGEITQERLDAPAPDPAAFGMTGGDDGSRTDPLMRNMPSCNEYEPDLDALRALGDRLVIAVGAQSGEELAARGGRSVADRVGIEPVVFPSNHAGFLGGEYGQTGDPEAFAAKLRAVLG